jgi:hypothetical protein
MVTVTATIMMPMPTTAHQGSNEDNTPRVCLAARDCTVASAFSVVSSSGKKKKQTKKIHCIAAARPAHCLPLCCHHHHLLYHCHCAPPPHRHCLHRHHCEAHPGCVFLMAVVDASLSEEALILLWLLSPLPFMLLALFLLLSLLPAPTFLPGPI